MLEQTVCRGIEEAYSDLKAVFAEKGCRVFSEKAPTQIAVKQGSLWAISPKTAKKTITVNLTPFDGGIKLSFCSKLNSDWANITVVGWS